MSLLPPDPLDPDAPGLDEATRHRRRMLAEMEKMTPQELFEIAVRAGIFTPEGELTAKYQDDSPSPYRDALSDSALDVPILDILRDPAARASMHYHQVLETLRRRWVVIEDDVLRRLRRLVAAGFLTETDSFHFSVTDRGRKALPAR